MIKRIRLVDGPAAASPAAAASAAPSAPAAARSAAASALAAPDGIRPLRVTVGVAALDVDASPRFDAVELEWYRDAAHLAAFEAWTATPSPSAAGVVVVAEERVGRGAQWLERRWRDGGPALKQMAVARRAAGLTPAAFSELWAARAGSVGTTPIPAEARGSAYVQNHPLPGGTDWPYDAVNEVYVDGVEALRTRIAWFAANLGTSEDDLVGESHFVALREEVLATP